MATLFLVCDLSGSMVESGKRFIVRNLIRTVDQYYRLQRELPEIKLVAWADEAIVAKWQPGQEVPEAILACSGSASGEALVEKLAPGRLFHAYERRVLVSLRKKTNWFMESRATR